MADPRVDELALRIPASRAGLATALAAIARWLDARAVEPAAAARVALVAEEALMNVALHGSDPGLPPRELQAEVQLRLGAGVVELCLQDDGRPFNPLEAAPPPRATSVAEAVPGGQGIALLRHFSRTMAYERREGRNVLRLTLAR